MRLIHAVIEDLRALHDKEVTPMGSALIELLGGERGSLIDPADRFTEAGLGHIMASWISNGPNLPVSTHHLRPVLGEAWVEELAALAGLESETFLRCVVHLLPEAVHRMTPESGVETPAEPGRPHHG